MSAKRGDAVEAPGAPEAEGMEFLGWDGFTGFAPESATIYEAVYERKAYELVWVMDGAEVKRERVVFGDAVRAGAYEGVGGRLSFGWGRAPASMPAGDLTVRGFSVGVGPSWVAIVASLLSVLECLGIYLLGGKGAAKAAPSAATALLMALSVMSGGQVVAVNSLSWAFVALYVAQALVARKSFKGEVR